MATSEINQLNTITELIQRTDPKSVLDIGVGFGKYGVLCREYLEVFGIRERAEKSTYDWQRRIDGIEGYPDYLSPMTDFIYTNIYKGNAVDILPTIKDKYDLILFIGILEHFTYEDGLMVLKECRRIGRNIIISAPKDIGPGHDDMHNPYQTHRFQWEPHHFDEYRDKFLVPHQGLYIVYIGEQAQKLGQKMKKLDDNDFKWRLGQRFPLFRKAYQLVQKIVG